MVAVLLAMLILLGGQAVSRAVDPATNKASVDEAIRVIRQQYEEINAKAAKYRKVKKELSGFSTEGGELVAYFDGDVLAKIELTFYGESGQASEEYYYWDGQLIFLYRADSNYDRLYSGKISHTEKSRCYFRNNELITWIDERGKTVPTKTDQYQMKQKECLRDASEFSQAARSPATTIEATR